MADRVRGYFFWLLAASVVGGLWFYADARSAVARTPGYLPPPPGFPLTQPAGQSPWHWALNGDEAVTVTDPSEAEFVE